MIALLLLLLSAVICSNVNNVHCGFSTKTAYMDSFSPEQIEFMNNPENYKIDRCTPEQIYILLRHGSRYPSTKQVDKSKSFLDAIREYRSTHEKQRPNVLDELEVTFENEPHYRLSELGASEMREIARRFKARYPNLFDRTHVLSPLENAKAAINIKSSDRDRSIQSAHHFLLGLYRNNENEDESLSPEDRSFEKIAEFLNDHIDVNNRMMRLFDECQSYMVKVRKNESAFEELIKFKRGPEMAELVQRLKKRLDIEDFDVSPSLVQKLFVLCNIESAHRMPLNWCKLFIDDDYHVLSYLNDLKGYWMKSFGHHLNSKMIFLVIKDLFAEMEKQILDDAKKHSIILRFGHAENIFPLVSALKIFDDGVVLRADNFKENLNRRFKSALMTPFSSNVAFVLHKCNNVGQKATDEFSPYKIHLLVNELPISQINAGELKCNEASSKDGSFCRFVDMKNMLSEYLSDEYEEVCLIEPRADENSSESSNSTDNSKIDL